MVRVGEFLVFSHSPNRIAHYTRKLLHIFSNSPSSDPVVRGLKYETYFGFSYAIGGLAGGEDKDSFWRVVAQCTAALPDDKPRYVMV